MKNFLTSVLAAALTMICVSSAVFLGSCGTIAGNPGEDGNGDNKTSAVAPVIFALTDASVDDAKSVLITVESLEVSLEGESWISIPLSLATEVDLLQYQGGDTLPLASLAALPVGTYKQTRLKLKEGVPSRLVLGDGTEHELAIPSAEQTGIKIVTPFTHEEGKELKLTIDFDLRKSVKKTGPADGKGNGNGGSNSKYMMKPTLRLVRDDGTGIIKGTTATGEVVCVFAGGAVKDASNECETSENSATVKDGQFKIAFVPAGTYDLRIYAADGATEDRNGIKIESGAITEAAGN